MQDLPPVAAPSMPIAYRGKSSAFFRLMLVNVALTVLTLGIYRFWAKTRMRRYLWSAIAPGNDPLEYTGNGVEKLLGFLIAVAFLAVYLGLFQLFLGFIGLSLFSKNNDPAAQALRLILAQSTLIAVIPFYFYAQYRARRYILSRTRWRGIRFGVDPDAWGYVWRALLHWLLTILSLGLLLPRQTFWLEKYKIDRTWYGTAQFEQGGSWPMLYKGMFHLFIAIGIFVALGISILASGSGAAMLGTALIRLPIIFLAVIWFVYGYFHYRVSSFKLLAAYKTLDHTVGFTATTKTGKVFWKTVLGILLTGICALLVLAIAGMLAGVFGFGNIRMEANLGKALTSLNPIEIAYAIFTYLAVMGLGTVFYSVFVSQPVLAHYVTTTRINNPEALLDIQQRSRDEMVEAEGFADALDVGAAI
jgi:uncharacterized membrane protein YjgN (DUF898 family)